MNLEVVFKIIKTVLGKDVDPTEIAKPWYLKRRYWGLAIFIASALAYKYYGLVLGNDVQEVILNNIDVIINSMPALISAIGAIYGVFVTAKGQRGQTVKMEEKVIAEKTRADALKQVIGDMPVHLPESPSE